MLVYRHLIAVSIGAIITLGGSLPATSQEGLSSGGRQTAQNVPTFPQSEEIIPQDSNFSMSEPEPPMAPFSESLQGREDYINPFLQIPEGVEVPLNIPSPNENLPIGSLEFLDPSA
ncbi:MAG: hypothetical protein WA865_14525, partial [Spirulinaceae cyanobacterium]